jgi:transcriptional regulator with XRE-family HTH domain
VNPPPELITMDTRTLLPRMIGDEIRSARARLNLSRDALAAKSGISAKTIQRLEHGERPADVVQMQILGEVLGVEITDLLGRAIARTAEQNGTRHSYSSAGR